MRVTEIEIVLINPNNGHVGYCHFVLDDKLVFNDIAIHSRKDGNGIRLVFPKLKSGLQAVFPISKEFTDQLCSEIGKVYLNLVS